MAKPMKTFELHYPMIQFLIIKINVIVIIIISIITFNALLSFNLPFSMTHSIGLFQTTKAWDYCL